MQQLLCKTICDACHEAPFTTKGAVHRICAWQSHAPVRLCLAEACVFVAAIYNSKHEYILIDDVACTLTLHTH